MMVKPMALKCDLCGTNCVWCAGWKCRWCKFTALQVEQVNTLLETEALLVSQNREETIYLIKEWKNNLEVIQMIKDWFKLPEEEKVSMQIIDWTVIVSDRCIYPEWEMWAWAKCVKCWVPRFYWSGWLCQITK